MPGAVSFFAAGLILSLLDVFQLRKLALYLEDLWGGRAGLWSPQDVREMEDPFVLFVHHRHTFWPLDPIRYLAQLFIPEGFPAHPHRGFQTVTYVMRVSVDTGCVVLASVLRY